MDNVTVTFNTLLQLFGAIAVVGGGVKIIVSAFSPFRALREEVSKIKGFLADDKKRLEDSDRRISELDSKIDRLDDALTVLGLAVSEMINHEITGNDVGDLKKQQKKLNEFFYKGKESK